MRQIRDMSIMEIDITNACGHKCSNCTRFCGHHEKTYFMDFETFKRAVDSLDGYQGLISTIGGEPLLHPEYDRFAEYLRNKRQYKYVPMNDGRCKALTKDYLAFAKAQRWFEGAINRGRGNLLFTSMPANYYDHYEAVEDTVTDLWLNDHTNPSFHQPILVSRKDLGIDDDTFAKMRDNCWLQNFWSASITPKGAFFCEIAGTLDLLFNGPGGKEILPGWWDQDLAYFQDQFHWCDICGMALATYSRNANEERDDASESLFKRLESINSPKLRNKQVYHFDMVHACEKDGESIGADMNSVTANYLPDNKQRVGNSANNLKPQKIYLGLCISSEDDIKNVTNIMRECEGKLDSFCIVTDFEHFDLIKTALSDRPEEIKVIAVDTIPDTIGGKINAMSTVLKRQEWLVLSETNSWIPEKFSERIMQYFVNPGYVLTFINGSEKIIMVSGISGTLKKIGFVRLQNCQNIDDLLRLCGEKVCVLDEDFDRQPDMNIPYFRELIRNDYLSDKTLKRKLSERLTKEKIGDKPILLLQSAFVYHTLGLYYLLKEMRYNVYVLSSYKFEEYFDGVVDNNKLFIHKDEAFRYQSQEEMRKKVKENTIFAGAIVPFSFGPSTVKHIDDYTDALKTAEDLGGKILGIINIRREFIETEYDIWEDEDCINA